MPNMDYSLIQRTPDGTGKILVTTPGSPDKGSYVLESDMKIYTNQGMVAIADIVDDLVTADAAKPLSANQGVVLKHLIDAFSGGIVPKGDILSSNLPAADASNKGWQYYCTDINKWATSDGTQWIMTSNNVITQTPDATDTGHALSNAVVTQCCNDVKGRLDQHESRLENLEQVAGDYGTWHYPNDPNHSSDMPNKVPTGKAKYGLVKNLVGKSRAWNQLMPTASLNFTNKGLTISSNNDGTITISGTTSGTGAMDIISNVGSTIAGRKYLLGLQYVVNSGTSPSGSTFAFRWGDGMVGNPWCYEQATIVTGNIDKTGTEDFMIYIWSTGLAINITIKPIFRDLTIIFGSGNEPSTVADALAQLPALGEYNAYDAGSLVSTEVSGVKSVGVNIWDEEWEHGGISSSTGADSSSSVKGRSADFIPIKPNTAYYILSAQRLYYRFYDREKNYLGDMDGNNNPSGYNTLMTTPSSCFFFRFVTDTAISSNSIQICLNSLPDAIKTTYHPYKTDTLSLPETVTLKSAGSVSDELDIESGVVTRKIGSVDLGTLDWSYGNAEGHLRFYCTRAKSPSDMKFGSSTANANAICQKYEIDTTTHIYSNEKDKTIGIGDSVSEAINVMDTSYTDAATFKAAMSGVILYYELATPDPNSQATDPVIVDMIETEGGGTINTIQTQTPVIDNCLDVGYLTV